MPDPRPTHPPQRVDRLRPVVALGLAVVLLASPGLLSRSKERGVRLLGAQVEGPRDRAAWGDDHVGRPLPEFTAGDECLFCHRPRDGLGYAENRHVRSLRPVDENEKAVAALRGDPALKPLAPEVGLILGGARRQRFLRPSRDYGRLDLLGVSWSPGRDDRPGRLLDAADPRWDADTFGHDCAGCHATAVDAGRQTFATAALDCYVCHGVPGPGHTRDRALVYLSPARRDPPQVVIAICAQCHARSGRSRSSGLPYPNHFVAGDNLFRDFEIDLDPGRLRTLPAADRHVLENVRDVVQVGKEVTCLSCHAVHRPTTAKHRRLGRGPLCLNCHDASGTETNYAPEHARSATCRY
jgi:predicted CXXCH cytochrome family protein